MLKFNPDITNYLRSTHILTSREIEILHLLSDGLKRPKIAEKLSISIYTVHTHMKSIHTKMDVHSDLELVAKTMRKRIA
jgi:DNA-binding NarL/FixJ family response regulator